MRNLVFATVLSVLAVTIAPPAYSADAGYLYDCDMTGHAQGKGWISPRLALVFPGDGTVTVVDAVTLTFSKEPVLGTILRDNAQRLVVKWTIKGARTDGGTSFANFDYRASISKGSGRIELTARPRTFDSGLRSGGTCRQRTE